MGSTAVAAAAAAPLIHINSGANLLGSSGGGSDNDFEQGIRILRESYSRKMSQKDAEIVQLRSELSRRDSEVKDLTHRVQQLEAQVARGDKRVAEMSRAVSKLASFKQAVMESLSTDDGDINELRRLQANAFTYSSPDVNIDQEQSGKETFVGDATTRVYKQQGNSSPGRYNDDIFASFSNISNTTTTNTGGGALRTGRESPSDANRRSQQHLPLSGKSPLQQTSQPNPTKRSNSHVLFDTDPFEPPSMIRGTTSGQSSSKNYHETTKPLAPPAPSGSGSPSNQPVQSIDGREFFRNARAVLSYDEFTALLANVKAYNNREQSRHRTLESLRNLLGERHGGICDQFEKLLAR